MAETAYTLAGLVDQTGYKTYTFEKAGNIYTADVADIGEGATYSTASTEFNLAGASQAWIACKTTGADAGSAGNVTFNFVAKGDSTQSYPTTPSFSVVLALNGTTAVVKDALINVGSYKWVKMLSIVNGDAAKHISATNVEFYIKY
jgi:hypothetical protein